jgi:hypothetical protein
MSEREAPFTSKRKTFLVPVIRMSGPETGGRISPEMIS